METCNWIVREGNQNSFWAFVPCKGGFNYLSKIKKASEIKEAYNNIICPICGKPIFCNFDLININDLLEEVEYE